MAADAMRTLPAWLVLLAAAATAAPLPPAARAEVDALLARLQSSGCEFNRNGSWYGGAEAKAHLLKKLDALEGKGVMKTAEQFIEHGASTSSVSGKPYLVRCAGQAPVQSATWLAAELQRVRAASAPARRSAASPRRSQQQQAGSRWSADIWMRSSRGAGFATDLSLPPGTRATTE